MVRNEEFTEEEKKRSTLDVEVVTVSDILEPGGFTLLAKAQELEFEAQERYLNEALIAMFGDEENVI